MQFIKRNQFLIASFLTTFFIASILFILGSARFPNDDQFILYRYVDNIISGNGFVFNVGERVLGSTTPLFTIISSFFALIFKGFQIPDTVAYLNIFLFSLSSVFLFKIAKEIFLIDDIFSYILILIYSLNLSKMIPEGMETPLFLFLVFAAIYFLYIKKEYISVIFLSLSVITRPDAILIFAIFFIYFVLNFDFRKIVKLSVLSVLVLLPWFIFATLYFGTFIPQSLLAKMHSSDIVRMPFYQAFKVMLANISRLYWGQIIDFNKIIFQVVFNLIPVIIMISLAIFNKLNKYNWFFFLIPFVYFIAFSLSNPIMFPWYVSQIEPFWITISFVGLYYLYKNTQSSIVLIFILLCLIFPLISYTKKVASNDIGSKKTLFRVSQYLNENIQKGQTVGISNIGIVSFKTKAYIIDFFGLVREDSVLYYPIENGCFDKNELYVIPPNLIKSSVPDWLVAGDGEMDPCFKNSSWFLNKYKEKFRSESVGVYKFIK